MSLASTPWKVLETSRPHRLMKTSSMQSKRRDSHPKWLHRETNDNTLLLLSLYHDEQQQSFSWHTRKLFKPPWNNCKQSLVFLKLASFKNIKFLRDSYQTDSSETLFTIKFSSVRLFKNNIQWFKSRDSQMQNLKNKTVKTPLYTISIVDFRYARLYTITFSRTSSFGGEALFKQ